MVRFLPPEPHLEHLKKEAKALLKAHRRGEAEACDVLRHVRRFRDADDGDILAADVCLSDMQFALAMDYGFSDWDELRKAVRSARPVPGYRPDADGDAVVLPDPPGGVDSANGFAAACSVALSYLGADAGYHDVLGDSGLAFILQADAVHTPYGTDVRHLDIGWWPLDPWGSTLRLDFLSRVYGSPIRRLPSDADAYDADPALHYRERHEREIAESLGAGRPAVGVVECTPYVVFGRDGGSPPLLGQPACVKESRVERLPQFPYEALVFGPVDGAMDRQRADAEALEFAVRLGRDEVDLSHLPGKSGGRRSWELWAEQVADEALCGPSFYHHNVLGHLRVNRTGAAAYLRGMAGRHAGHVGAELEVAAEHYDALLANLDQVDASDDALGTADGRESFVSLIREMMELEASAQRRMAGALAAMA